MRWAIVAIVASWSVLATASVQSCNTDCQSEQTDCVLRCDGQLACTEKCQVAADQCVGRCVTPER